MASRGNIAVKYIVRSFIWAVFCALAATQAIGQTQSTSSTSQPKPLEFIISTGAGAGYDAYARILARALPHYLSQHPQIIIRYMDGAGGLTATNYIANIAPRDGSSFAIVNNPIPYLPLLGETKAHYDSKQLTWIGSMAAEVGLLVATKDSHIDSLDLAISKGMSVATTGAGSGSYFNARVINRFIGTKLHIVSGYQTATQGLLAMERGEVDGFPALMWSTLNHSKPEWLTNNKINILAQLAFKPHPLLPHVPLIISYAKNDSDRMALELAFAPLEAARPLVAPPAIPTSVRDNLRHAFMAALDDEQFKADLKNERLETYGAMSGEELTALIDKVYHTPPDIVALVAAMFRDE
jgi:tripartite-type tricarboxylate transporter receptor subunit TctC